jgi:bifunctional UDP-N-acetylglucosamine pyrophosphorylase/glucosamine-1-phosphate N-acetyltransferase
MYTAQFAAPTTFRDQAELRTAFQAEALFLAPGASVTFAGKATLFPNLVFHGASRFGSETTIRSFTDLDGVAAGARNVFGPHAFVREGCTVGDDCILGAHVETTRSRFGNGVKVSHRAFIGDAELGDGVIVGAGVVFCNYDDGKGRLATRVGAGAAIGSGTLILAPLHIGEGAVIAAGSVITKDVAAGAKVIQKRLSVPFPTGR